MLHLLSCLGCRHHPVCLCAAEHAVPVNAVLLIAVGWEPGLSCCTTVCVSCGVVSWSHALSHTHSVTHACNWSLARSLILSNVRGTCSVLVCLQGCLVCMLGSSRPPTFMGSGFQDFVWDSCCYLLDWLLTKGFIK